MQQQQSRTRVANSTTNLSSSSPGGTTTTVSLSSGGAAGGNGGGGSGGGSVATGFHNSSVANAQNLANTANSSIVGGYQPPPVSSLTQGINDMRLSQIEPISEEDKQGGRSTSIAKQQNNAGQNKTISYSAERVIGNGSFGVVFLAKVVETGEIVAIKKVLQDKRFKNRELQIMRVLSHRNIVQMKHCFYSNGDKDELYLNLVLEFVPDTVYRFCRHFTKNKEYMPTIYVKLFVYQLCRALNFIHSVGICHRDIKPQNLLIDPSTGILKLCDFGSAKQLVAGEPNVSYICSRYYRAPELIFGATNYTSAIDTWSLGCVFAELLIGRPLFPGESSVDQLVEIIKVLGTPTREEIESMNKNYTEFKFPQVKPHPWGKVFRPHTPPEAIDVITKLLQYTPDKRILPIEACCHPFFDELRDPNTRLPNGRTLPALFDFTQEELKSLRPELRSKIIPPHATVPTL